MIWKKQNRKLGIACLGMSLFFGLVGGRPLPGYLLGTLEKPYKNVRLSELPKCDVVLVLGGGQKFSEQSPFEIELLDAGDRVIGAFEAMRQGKADTLVVSSGYYWKDGVKLDQGCYLTNWVRDWKIFDQQVISLGGRSNTRDEGVVFQELAKENGWKKILLVTSAFHTRRSVATFERLGFEVVPFPMDFYIEGIPQPRPVFSLVPGSRELKFFELWFKEVTGYWIYKLRG